jgi:hypothetical protein
MILQTMGRLELCRRFHLKLRPGARSAGALFTLCSLVVHWWSECLTFMPARVWGPVRDTPEVTP